MRVNYQLLGSSGIRQTIAGTVDFGGTDAAMTDADMGTVKNGVILVPTAGSAVSVCIYNIKLYLIFTQLDYLSDSTKSNIFILSSLKLYKLNLFSS